MMREIVAVATAFALVLGAGAWASSAPESPRTGDAAAGRRVFDERCASCHPTEPGASGFGPSLAGVVGRRAGSLPGYGFSTALRDSGITWTPETLNAWLLSPHQDVPRNRMPFPGLKNAQERADVIAYLKTLGHR